MKGSVIANRSIFVAGRKSCVRLESAFWKGLKEIAAQLNLTLSGLVSEIGLQRERGNLSSALRLFVLHHFRTQARRSVEG